MPWWVAGGWAIELFLGCVTRGHKDMDIAIARERQPEMARALQGWDIQIASAGKLTPWTAGDWLEGGKRHQFWSPAVVESPLDPRAATGGGRCDALAL
jgi:hypothetical protein